ncbi:unnamed protein product [Urochloa humidicola]
MSSFGGGFLRNYTMASAMKTSKKRPGSELVPEEHKLMAVDEVWDVDGDDQAEDHGCVMTCVQGEEPAAAADTTTKKKWRMPQDQIDFILSMDVSDYVFPTPDNIDDMPVSDEYKAQFRAERKQAVAVMQKSRSNKRKLQEWVKAELEKHGYVEIETTAEMLEKHHEEEYIDGQV